MIIINDEEMWFSRKMFVKYFKILDSVVGIATSYGLEDREVGVLVSEV
jgi:hypothetical protein